MVMTSSVMLASIQPSSDALSSCFHVPIADFASACAPDEELLESLAFGLSLPLPEQEVSVSAEARTREESSLRINNFYPQGVGNVQILKKVGGKLVFSPALATLLRADLRPSGV